MIEKAIKKILDVNAAFKSAFGDRFFPMVLPQDQAIFPALVYQKISGPEVSSHQGSSGLAHPRFQFRVWAKTAIEAFDGAGFVRSALFGYSGTVAVAGGSVDVNAILIEDGRDDYDENRKLFGRSIDVVVWHNDFVAA